MFKSWEAEKLNEIVNQSMLYTDEELDAMHDLLDKAEERLKDEDMQPMRGSR